MKVALGHITKSPATKLDEAIRLDLDDLGGEVCLMDWGEGPPTMSASASTAAVPQWQMQGQVSLTLAHDSSLGDHRAFAERLVRLQNNEHMLPLPKAAADPVAQDIADIPRFMKSITDSFRTEGSLNSSAANHFVDQVKVLWIGGSGRCERCCRLSKAI